MSTGLIVQCYFFFKEFYMEYIKGYAKLNLIDLPEIVNSFYFRELDYPGYSDCIYKFNNVFSGCQGIEITYKYDIGFNCITLKLSVPNIDIIIYSYNNHIRMYPYQDGNPGLVISNKKLYELLKHQIENSTTELVFPRIDFNNIRIY